MLNEKMQTQYIHMKIWCWDNIFIMNEITRRFVDCNIIYLGDISDTDCVHYQASTKFLHEHKTYKYNFTNYSHN